jgi:hypothetical protein
VVPNYEKDQGRTTASQMGGRWPTVESSGWVTGRFQGGRLIADRHGRPLTQRRCPLSGRICYLTHEGRLVAADATADPVTADATADTEELPQVEVARHSTGLWHGRLMRVARWLMRAVGGWFSWRATPR